VSNNVIAPPVALVATESANVDRLEQGRTLYLQRCSRCHAAPIIRTLTPDEWDYWLPDMLTDSALKGPPAEAVTAYVAAVLQAPAVVFAPPPRD
jgi:mono/diheme cytochrome c family protein